MPLHQGFDGIQNLEAKTVCLLVKNASNFTNVDHHKWLLKRLFQPLSQETDDNIQVIYESNKPLASILQNKNERKATETYTLQNLPCLTSKNYRLMPHSCVITLNTKYRFVFLLDVTSSLTTIDCINTKNTVMPEVMQTARRCLEGLVQPFMIQDLDKDIALQLEPEITITIIAECSNFASNANFIPMLADFPTMRVLLQGIIVNKNNISDIINDLQFELTHFQHEVAAFRQKLRRSKLPSNYVMEVEHESESPDKKNLWRLGSSGSNLAHSLNAGLLALCSLPNEGFPALIVITDGVVSSNLAQISPDDDIIQQLCKESVRCNIIQVGPREGYSPGCNFGLLPNDEILQFVAMATSGVFLYSSDCPDVKSPSLYEDFSLNFYHKRLLMMETMLSKKKDQISAPRQLFEDNNNFPWNPRSQPPVLEAMPMRYRDYPLPVDVLQLICARIRNGFIIESIILVADRDTKKVHITMSRFWQPNVTIQYKIKAPWMGERDGFSRLKSTRIEIKVLASTMLAIYLLNFQTTQQTNDPSHPLSLKCNRLHKFMNMIYETDDLLKKCVFYKISKEINKTHLIPTGKRIPPPLTRLRQLWDSFEQDPMRHNTNIWYDETKFDILISGEQPSATKFVDRSSEYRNAYSVLKERLSYAWSSYAFSDVYIKTFHPMEGEKILPVSFCELKINKISENLVVGTLLFFNVETVQRKQVFEDLITLINELNSDKVDGSLYYVCRRSLSSFLIQHPETMHYKPDHRHISGRICIVESYLRHRAWTWLSNIEHYVELMDTPIQDDIERYVLLMDKRNTPIQYLAFQHLCKARLDEGFLLISENRNRKIFYRELEFEENPDMDSSSINRNGLYGIQYHIYKNSYTSEIITELWMEPSQQPLLRNLYESVFNKISTVDRQILSQLETFDQIHYIAKTRTSRHMNPRRRNSIYDLALPKSSDQSLFDLPILLKSSGLLIANYNIPNFKSLSNFNQLHHYVRSSVKLPTPDGSTPRPNYEDSRFPESSIRKSSSNRSLFHVEVAQQRKLSLSLPKNLTNGVTYSIDCDSIATLSPIERDFALLHLFVEKTLASHVDGEIDTNNSSLKDSILEEINSGISKTGILQEALTTTTCIKNLRESRCFIKIVDFNLFLLVIIPSFKVILDVMKQDNGFQVDSKSCFMSIIIYLCKRSKPGDYTNKSLDFSRDQALSFESISLFHNATTPVKNSLEPILLSGSFPENPINFFKSDLSDKAARVALNITKLYSHGFVKSVYASVLQKHRVTKTDFLKALNACVETHVDIDITGYVNVNVKQRPDSDDVNDVHQQFVAVLGHFFEPANFAGDEMQNIYYYRPNRLNFKKQNLSVDTHESAADIAGSFLDIFDYAENPLFLRLECTFRKQTSTCELENICYTHDYAYKNYAQEGSCFVKFPVSTLPTSYSCIVDDKFHDFSPESIGTKTSPVESSDGTTATLHLVCLTLPGVENEVVAGPYDLLTEDEVKSAFGRTKESQTDSLNTLTADKQEALEETRKRIQFVLREEIMHGLLKSQPDELVLAYIKAQLKKKNPFVNFPTNFRVPLSFVRREQGLERFLKEFGKTNMSPYSLNQFEDCFCIISEDEILAVDNSDTASIFAIGDNADEREDGFYNDDGGEYFHQSLGISISSLGENDNVPVQAEPDKRQHKQFSLVLIPQETVVQMYFYSKAVSVTNCSTIIERVRNRIKQVSEKVNRLILLDELRGTRQFSKYLVPPDPDSESFPEDETSDFVDVLSLANVKMFSPGQFECPLVHKQSFPLHFRLKPNHALNGIATILDDIFGATNRKNLYIWTKEGEDHTFYLKISEVESFVNETLDDPAKSTRRELVIEVFGLGAPGKEITEDIMGLLERKLIGTITLNVMSNFLSRHRKVNPTKEDVEFILPVRKGPHSHSLKIPSYIRNIYAFIMYFRQNIALYLNILQGPDVTNAIKRHYNSKYGITRFPELNLENESSTTHDIQLHEFVFFYNYNPARSPNALEAAIGQGIAGLCFTLLDRQDQPVFELSVPDVVDSDYIDLNKILKYISNNEEFTISDSNKDSNDNTMDSSYRLLIELWSHGTLKNDILLDRITKSFRQSLCDYFIEVSITKGLGRVSLDNIGEKSVNKYVEPHVQYNFIEPAQALLKVASDLVNPALHSLHERLNMPSWMMDDFLSEVHELLVGIHDIFIPIIFRTTPTASMYEIYWPKYSVSTTDETTSVPHQYLLIAGLREMNAKYSRTHSVEDITDEKAAKAQQRLLTENIMMHTIPDDDQVNYDLFRSCFLVMSISGFGLSIYIYNWDKNYADKVFTAMKRISDWYNKRIELLNNILRQKMGLFYHASAEGEKEPDKKVNVSNNAVHRNIHSRNVAADLKYVNALIRSERQADEIKKISPDLNEILRDSCVEKIAGGISIESRDALMRHGPPFMETCETQSKIIQAQDNAEKVYKKWDKRYQDHSDTNEVIAKSDLAILLRTFRLLHFCRTPLLFGSSSEQQNKTMISKWCKDMTETFLQEYSHYLEKLGMQVVVGGKSGLSLIDDSDKIPISAPSDSIVADQPAVFLMKTLQGGSIICEILIQEFFVSVTLYTLNRRYGHRRLTVFGPTEVDRHSQRLFTEECGRLKRMIHVNSFVYDFHLKYINHVLRDLVHSPFNVLEVLRAFVRRYSQPAYFAFHRIYNGTYSKESSSIPNDLFEYIIKDPLRYDFHSNYYDGKPIACFATLNEADNESTQSILIFTDDQSDKSVVGKISLEYFVIVLQNETSIEVENTVGSIEFHRQTTDPTYLDFSEIKNHSWKRLDLVASQAIQCHRRDLLWRVLCNAKTNGNNDAMNIQDFIELKNQWYSRELVTIYPDFKEFLDIDLNWNDLLSFLSHYYNEFSRELYEEENHSHHLVILNSHTYDLLLHFNLPNSSKDNKIEQGNDNYNNVGKPLVNIVCREASDSKELELRFAADLVRTIGYWLWQMD